MRPSSTLQKIVFGFSAILLLCLLTGCFHHYYTTKEPVPSNTDQYVSSSKYQNRYFILRSGDDAYHMSNVVLSEDRKSFTCQLDTLEPVHTLHLYKGRGGNMRYRARLPEAAVLNEVHLYIPDDTIARLHSACTIPVNTIKRVEVVEKDKGRTIASTGLVVLGIVALPIGILLIGLVLANS